MAKQKTLSVREAPGSMVGFHVVLGIVDQSNRLTTRQDFVVESFSVRPGVEDPEAAADEKRSEAMIYIHTLGALLDIPVIEEVAPA